MFALVYIKHAELKVVSLVTVRCKRTCYKWMCGDIEKAEVHITAAERMLLRQRMTSLHQNQNWTRILNFSAGLLLFGITFLFGLYA